MSENLRKRPIPWQANSPTALEYHHVPVDLADERSDEPLVDLAEMEIAGYGYYAREDGFNAPYYRAFLSASERILCRRSVAARLVEVNGQLSKHGVELFVLNGYRSPAVQGELWAFFMERARTVLDDPTEANCVAFAGIYCSDPRSFDENDSRTWPVHVTGGALDTTIRSRETRELLHMGGIFDDPAETSHTAYFENKLIHEQCDERMLTLSDNEALRNRRLLYWAMTDAGFTNYAYEWWHFDWGTQLWVMNRRARSGSPTQPRSAWYGPAFTNRNL